MKKFLAQRSAKSLHSAPFQRGRLIFGAFSRSFAYWKTCCMAFFAAFLLQNRSGVCWASLQSFISKHSQGRRRNMTQAEELAAMLDNKEIFGVSFS
jgi:hypothetical protein